MKRASKLHSKFFGIIEARPKMFKIFLVLFAVAAVVTLFAVQAATPTASVEVEQGNLAGKASLTSSISASGGSAVKFGGTVTTSTLCNGYSSWNTSSNWVSGTVPAPGQDVTIAAGKKVVMDSTAFQSVRLKSLTIPAGTELCFKDQPITFRVGSIMVFGVLQMGTEAQPIQSKIELVLDGLPADPKYDLPATEINDNTANAPTFNIGNSVLAVRRGGRLDIHGKKIDRTWTKLAQTAAKGSNSIVLADSVNNQWAVGDKIVLAPSGLKPLEYDESVITSISSDGKTIVLAAPLQYQHVSVSTTLTSGSESRTIEERPEVGLLSHNIVVRGPDNADTTKYGGHIISFYQAVQRISGAQLYNLGQQGILGKYPVHFHHTIDASTSRFEGNSIVRSFNRMLAIHNANNLTVTNNVGHDTFGHAIMQENGTETGGVITKNLIMTARRAPDGKRLMSPGFNGNPRIAPGFGRSDDTPACFWLTNPTNTITDNAATGCEGTGIWMDFGPDPENSDNLNARNARTMPITAFDRNVAHSNQDSPAHNGGDHRFQATNGIFIDAYIGNFDKPSVINDNVAWKNWDIGFWVDGGVISVNPRAANNRIASLNGFSASQKGAFILHSAGTNMNDTSNNGETSHLETLTRWYAVGSEYENTWYGNFAPTFTTSNRDMVAAINGGLFESQGFTPRMRTAKFFNEIASGTNKSHRTNFSRNFYEAQYLEDADGSIIGTPGTISDSSNLGSATSSIDMYPGEKTGGSSWSKYLPGTAYMKIFSVEPFDRDWRITRESDNRSQELDSGNHRHSFLMNQRYHYATVPASQLTSFDIHSATTDRPGYTEIWIDWAPSTAPKVTKKQIWWMETINATQASSLADLATGKDYYWDQANKRVYLRLNSTGQASGFVTPSTGLDSGSIRNWQEYSVRQ